MPSHDQRTAVSSFRHRFSGLLTAAAGLGLATLLGTALTPAGLFGAGQALAVPEPRPVPTRWELTFEPGPLRMVTLSDEQGNVQPYFYMTYKVTNFTGQDRLFAPLFDLSTEEGELLRSGRDVPGEAIRAIIDRLGNPLLEDPISIVGQLLQGEENAKFGLAVWPVTRMDVDELKVFATGFSGESETYRALDPQTGRYRDYVLRKTLMLRHLAPGDLVGRGDEPFRRVESRWVMR